MKLLLIAATALVLAGGAAFGQAANSNSGSNSNATVTTGSQATSISNPRQTTQVIGNPIGNGASSSVSGSNAVSSTRSASRSAATGNALAVTVNTGSAGAGDPSSADPSSADPSGSGGGDPTINYTGGYTVKNTPEVIPPSVIGGNPCSVGISAGVSLPGVGVAGGGTWADKACERRQEAALLFNMGEHRVAVQLLCQDDHVRDAMKMAGTPCFADVAATAAPAVAATAPAPAIVAAAPPPPPPSAPKPDWCPATNTSQHLATLSDGQQAYVRKQCGSASL